jgi:hypothetical protein
MKGNDYSTMLLARLFSAMLYKSQGSALLNVWI